MRRPVCVKQFFASPLSAIPSYQDVFGVGAGAQSRPSGASRRVALTGCADAARLARREWLSLRSFGMLLSIVLRSLFVPPCFHTHSRWAQSSEPGASCYSVGAGAAISVSSSTAKPRPDLGSAALAQSPAYRRRQSWTGSTTSKTLVNLLLLFPRGFSLVSFSAPAVLRKPLPAAPPGSAAGAGVCDIKVPVREFSFFVP